ncbi:Chitin binding domain [Trinorchestia longiramus]|nr:Chitin binding domain [Trinorchestia longiramus]
MSRDGGPQAAIRSGCATHGDEACTGSVAAAGRCGDVRSISFRKYGRPIKDVLWWEGRCKGVHEEASLATHTPPDCRKMNKSVLLILLVAVAAAEGRARGAKLGHRSTRQQALWGTRQDPYGQTPAVAQSGYPPSQGSGSPDAAPAVAPAPAPAPVYPSGAPSTGAPQTGYPVDNSAPQIPIVVPGNISPASIPKCLYPGFFATPGSCVNFYRCVDWTGTGAYYSVFQFNCPPGTIFDDDLDICSHIAWVVPKRPECKFMLSSSLVPLGSGPPAPGTGGGVAPGSGYGPGVGVAPQPPVQPPLAPGPIYPQPGVGQVVPPVSPGIGSDGTAPPRPFTLQCFSGDAYRRHPLYCNRYYRCQWDGSDWVFPMLTCPRGLIFDEAAQGCADPATVARCPGQIAPEPTPEGGDATESTTITDTTPTEESSTTPMVDPSSLYDCPAKGYYPFEGDCIRFYKCVELDTGFLKGLLYKCPDEYGYSEDKERCDKQERLPPCTKTVTPAHLRQAPTRQLTVEDLTWFFNE